MRTFILPLFMLALAGCVDGSAEFGYRLRQVDIGMSKREVFSVFGEAVPRGAKQYPNGIVEVLEVRHDGYAPFDTRADPWTGYVKEPPTWFYFYNGRLVQYGAANDWPADPDKIIEIRHR